MTEYLITLTGSYNLPRKYKIAFSGCGSDCAFTQVNDLGFVARIKDGKPGFTVYAGGGMGGFPRVGDLMQEWVPASDVICIAEAVRRIFDRTGNRRNKHRARLRFVFEKIGADAFREMFREQIEKLRDEDIPSCKISPEPLEHSAPQISNPEFMFENKNGVRYFPQRQQGFVAVPLHLPLGYIPWEDFHTLADISEKYSDEKGLRTTQSQNLILRFVRPENLEALAQELGRLSIDVLSPNPLESFVACTGSDTCRLGLCLSRNISRACADAIARDGVDPETFSRIDVRINGCPNSCGQHPIGTIGLFGTAQRVDERLLPSYRIFLGARRGEAKTRLGEYIATVPARALPQFMLELIRDFQRNHAADEPFPDYYDRKGPAFFKTLAEKHSHIPPYAENPDYYRDWDQEQDFSLAGRGPGECGAGVFDVITEDISAAKELLEKADSAEDKGENLFKAFLATVRALLITRGIDSQNPDEIMRSFETHLIDTGFVNEEFRGLLARGRGYLEGWKNALNEKATTIMLLLERIELLFTTLDADLKFHPQEESAAEQSQPPTQKKQAPEKPVEDNSSAELDLRGVACPMNFVKAKLKLEMMETGQTLAITLDDGEPIRNVPASFRDEGQEVVEETDLGEGHWQVVIRKK